MRKSIATALRPGEGRTYVLRTAMRIARNTEVPMPPLPTMSLRADPAHHSLIRRIALELRRRPALLGVLQNALQDGQSQEAEPAVVSAPTDDVRQLTKAVVALETQMADVLARLATVEDGKPLIHEDDIAMQDVLRNAMPIPVQGDSGAQCAQHESIALPADDVAMPNVLQNAMRDQAGTEDVVGAPQGAAGEAVAPEAVSVPALVEKASGDGATARKRNRLDGTAMQARNAEIQRRLQAGEAPAALAAEYGISESMVRKIRSGKW